MFPSVTLRASKCRLSRQIVQRNVFWTRTLTPAGLHKALVHLNLTTVIDLQFWIKVTFTKSISAVILKLVKIKKQNKNVWVPIYIVNFPSFFSPSIFNLPFNTTANWRNAKIVKKLTRPRNQQASHLYFPFLSLHIINKLGLYLNLCCWKKTLINLLNLTNSVYNFNKKN